MFRARSISSIWTTWLTAWVVLLGALAPSISHGLTPQAQARSGLFGSAICSSVKHTKAKSTSSPQPVQADLTGSHCPFCIPHDGSIGLPPTALTPSVALMDTAHAEPFLFLHAPRPLHAWAAAQPRAPPAAWI